MDEVLDALSVNELDGGVMVSHWSSMVSNTAANSRKVSHELECKVEQQKQTQQIQPLLETQQAQLTKPPQEIHPAKQIRLQQAVRQSEESGPSEDLSALAEQQSALAVPENLYLVVDSHTLAPGPSDDEIGGRTESEISFFLSCSFRDTLTCFSIRVGTATGRTDLQA